ncbi:MAG: PKD domain-containing protein [Candidatus Acetothermia bacterium]|jgi:PKD repeat protein|nr:PKD domain-containing protein [Candidatus Acetothermia bacterium]MDH7505513.1 PKD domain-containing protein [Candidatus Acetothermia bacterium]
MKLRLCLAVVVCALGAVSLYAGSNSSPQADFSYAPGSPTANDIVTFDGSSSSDPDGRIVRYEWDFNGDGAFERASEFPRYNWVYDAGGSYRVSLRVTDDGGATAVGTREITVSAASPAAPAGVCQTIFAPLAPNRVLPGQQLKVVVELVFRETVRGPGLAIKPPTGWRLRAVENGGATNSEPHFDAEKGEYQWLWANEASFGDRLRIVYEVEVPGSAPRGLYKIEGFVSSFSPRFRLPIPKDVEVQVL